MGQIEQAISLLEKHDFELYDEELIEGMEELGFETTWSTGYAFIGDTHVIKKAFFCGPKPKQAIETRFLQVCPDDHELEWVVQPMAEEISLELFLDLKENTANLEEEFGHDVEISNIGTYNNTIVAIDW